jgi:hypothetical protein
VSNVAAPAGHNVAWEHVSAIVVNGALVRLTLINGTVWSGLLAHPRAVLALIAAIRLARPASPWARWRYKAGRRTRQRPVRDDGRQRRVELRNRIPRRGGWPAVMITHG